MTRRRTLLAATAAMTLSSGAVAQSRPIRLIVPFPPGGTADLLARLTAREMEAALAQSIVVENRPGAGAVLGSDVVAKSAPDGTTLLLSNIASQGIAPAVLASMPYDTLRDFTHIALIAAVPSGVVVSATSPYATLRALLDAARARPGGIRFGSNGNGTSSHVKLEMLKRVAGVDITHVPYRGAAPAVTDILAGHIEGLIAAVPDVGRNERLRMLAVTTAERLARWPDVPSIRELGFATLVASNWFGVSGPAGIAPDIADRLNAAITGALAAPALAERLADAGTAPNRLTRAEFTALIAADIARWGEIVRAANIRAD